MTKHIVLLGPMGAGKSAVGATLSSALERPFEDSDAEVERYVGTSISELFATLGEPHFRALELAAVHHLLASSTPSVISLGGGAFVQEGVRALCLKLDALTIYLETSPETSWARVRTDSGRPLLAVPDPLGRLTELLAARRFAYEQARITLSTNDRSAEEVADDLRARLQ